uniref:Uncharacterized protein n=1 Tax=Cacopsylla melanoneura TaxID=428564 RepID=A0A8D8TZP4_9HEMI
MKVCIIKSIGVCRGETYYFQTENVEENFVLSILLEYAEEKLIIFELTMKIFLENHLNVNMSEIQSSGQCSSETPDVPVLTLQYLNRTAPMYRGIMMLTWFNSSVPDRTAPMYRDPLCQE